MENQFTTTFIPKKPLMETSSGDAPVSRPVGLLSTISLILFIITIFITGIMYFWKSYETSNVASLSSSVDAVSKDFEPQLITQLQSLDRQLQNANMLVKNHTVISPIFDVLEASTLKQVQFSKFDVTFDPTAGIQVKMSGLADGYQSIAEQSDVLGSNTFLTDVIFSNFNLTQDGKVSFDLTFGVRPEFLNFQTAPIDGAQTPVTAAATVPPQGVISTATGTATTP